MHGIALAWRQADDLTDADIPPEKTYAVEAFLRGLAKDRIQLDDRAVVVIDELSLLGTRQLNAILEARSRFNFQLVAIGDPKQMQAVEAGPVIDLLQRALGEDAIPELIRSVRQRDAEDRETTLMFRNGQTEEAVARKVANGTLKLVPGAYEEAVGAVVDLCRRVAKPIPAVPIIPSASVRPPTRMPTPSAWRCARAAAPWAKSARIRLPCPPPMRAGSKRAPSTSPWHWATGSVCSASPMLCSRTGVPAISAAMAAS